MTLVVFAGRVEREYMPTVGGGMRTIVRRDMRFLAEDLRVDRVDQFDADLLRRFLELVARQEGWKDSTRSRHVSGLRVLYRLAHRWGYIGAPPPFPKGPDTRDRPADGLTDGPDPAVVRTLTDHLAGLAESSREWHESYALHVLAAWGGLWLVEALDLMTEDFDEDSGAIRVGRRESKRKTALPNPVYLKGNPRRILAGWKRLVGPGPLFPNKEGSGVLSRGDASIRHREAARQCSAEEAGSFDALRRFHVAHVRMVPVIPGPEPAVPRPLRRQAAGREREPERVLEPDEVTRMMALQRQRSGTWQGHRLYLALSLAFHEELREEEIHGLAPSHVRPDLSPPQLYVAGRAAPVLPTATTADIARRWRARDDYVETKYFLPGASLTVSWGHHGGVRKSTLMGQVRRLARDAKVTGRVTLRSVRRSRRRSGELVELGEAWRSVPDPEPIFDGPRRPRRYGPEPREARGPAVRTRPDPAAWNRPIPAIEPIGQEGRLYALSVFGERVRIASGALFEAIVALRAAFPAGLSKAHLDHRCRGWRTAFYRELKRTPALREAILCPGDEGSEGDYRIVDIRTARRTARHS
jgi:integrase